MAPQTASIAANIELVRERVAGAAERSGRQADAIVVVAVSKTFPAEAIRRAYDAGLHHFGENRVQEWEAKQPLLAGLEATWHLVGHLQTNKARRAARLFHAIDSVHTVALARKLDSAFQEVLCAPSPREVQGQGGRRRLSVLLEVRLAPEESKSGVAEGDLPTLAEAVWGLPHLELRGLMCIPPYFDDPERARPFFAKLRELRGELSRRLGGALPELSMGMSYDFEIAIEEGATQVRLGAAIFGPRQAE